MVDRVEQGEHKRAVRFVATNLVVSVSFFLGSLTFWFPGALLIAVGFGLVLREPAFRADGLHIRNVPRWLATDGGLGWPVAIACTVATIGLALSTLYVIVRGTPDLGWP